MAFSGGADTDLLINGYDLTTFFGNTQMGGTSGAYDTSVYGVGSKTYIPGLKDARWSLSGFFSGSAGEIDAVLEAALGVADAVGTVFPQGDALGNSGRGISGHVVNHSAVAPVDGVVSTTAEIQSKVGPERILSHAALAAHAAATTNFTSIDNAASSANGGHGYVQATAVGGGFSTATIKIQHSTDDSVWADLITFTAITAANAKERVAVAGTVNRYTRAQVASTGGTITAQVAFGRK